uniref:RNase H type-1 domain-containing protein n=1 Tax=Cannabis sativa TaxID=3483 RepID=A0A803QFR4_CANSA
MERLMVPCWRIWYHRNHWVHDHKLLDVEGVLGWAFFLACNYQEANSKIGGAVGISPLSVSSTVFLSEPTWSPLPIGVFKLNMDDRLRFSECRMGFGAVIRDHNGTCIASIAS